MWCFISGQSSFSKGVFFLKKKTPLMLAWCDVYSENVYIIKTLKEFQYIDEYGKDQGANGKSVSDVCRHVHIPPLTRSRFFFFFFSWAQSDRRQRTYPIFFPTNPDCGRNDAPGLICAIGWWAGETALTTTTCRAELAVFRPSAVRTCKFSQSPFLFVERSNHPDSFFFFFGLGT
jgi:hypothetical protein